MQELNDEELDCFVPPLPSQQRLVRKMRTSAIKYFARVAERESDDPDVVFACQNILALIGQGKT